MKMFFSGCWRKFVLHHRLSVIEREKQAIIVRGHAVEDSPRFVQLLEEQTRIEIELGVPEQDRAGLSGFRLKALK